ncbi:CDP-glycerol glycerophosphotransferase family protein, partial [Colwellia sp. 6M3]|uniref:CDP-glycerol glycerophosphotransferase family protein n=1 Tax=Colwellia sp. 6M3 TaxID=2759849 RepID=UPI0015F76DB3
VLIPIYKKLKELHPEIEVYFGYKSYEPRIRAGFSKTELSYLKTFGEKMYICPQHARADITFIADAVYDWIYDCGKIVNVGHGILSKGQYYMDTELARREEKADLVCVPGIAHKEVLSNVISTPIAVTGMAKLDNLFDESITREAVELSLGLPQSDKKYVLFAPTFNDELSLIPFVKHSIADFIPNANVKILIKLHGSTKPEYVEMYKKLAKNDERITFIQGLDLTPLIVLADIMISDVSSAIMEFAAFDKPVILFNSPTRFSYKNYNEQSIEYKYRDLGIEVENYKEIKNAIIRSIENPMEYSQRRQRYTDLLVANKSNAKGCENIITESLKLL